MDDIARHITTQLNRLESVRLPAAARDLTIDAAYGVQTATFALRSAPPDRRTGFKIASTTLAAQRAVGLTTPAYAALSASGDISPSGRLAMRGSYPIGIECELAVIIGQRVEPQDDVVAAIAEVAVACEFVEDRYGGLAQAGAACLIADNFAHRAYALGPRRPFDAGNFDASALRATVTSNGETLGTGTPEPGPAHPLEALRWLHSALAGRGEGLAAGDLVLTGAIAPPVWLTTPKHLTLELEPLGRLDIVVGPALEDTGR